MRLAFSDFRLRHVEMQMAMTMPINRRADITMAVRSPFVSSGGCGPVKKCIEMTVTTSSHPSRRASIYMRDLDPFLGK